MNKKYTIYYKNRVSAGRIDERVDEHKITEIPTREEAEEQAQELKEQGYHDIVIEETRI